MSKIAKPAETRIVKLSVARQALQEARTLQDVKEIHDLARAAKVYAQERHLGHAVKQDAAEIVVRAERRLGELLAPLQLHGGDRKSTSTDTRLKLTDLGISYDQSSRWQQAAQLPEAAFETHLATMRQHGKDITSAGVYRLARMHRRKPETPSEVPEGFVTDLQTLVAAIATGQRPPFQCLYMDPPWKYDNQGTRASTNNHYPTMTLDALHALPIAQLVAGHCHLHLWTTNAFLFECPALFAAWGFTFKSSFVWVKPQIGIGNYWRNAHEFLLLGVRGSLTAQAKDLPSWLEARRTAHSEKPERIRQLVEQLSPGPYLELFGRRQVEGWTVWGNECQPSTLRLLRSVR